jgi:hypothetical protein
VEGDGADGMNLQGIEDQGWRRISNSAVALWDMRRAVCTQQVSCYSKPGQDKGRVLRATGAETEGPAAEMALSVERAALHRATRNMGGRGDPLTKQPFQASGLADAAHE